MSDDPETLRQIEELSHDDRPLLVLDVDDVVLEFIGPFPRFLQSQGFELRLETFRIHGSVFDVATGKAVEREQVSALIDAFFLGQSEWQTLTEGAAEAMAGIARRAEIVMLTAMPHRHRDTRRAHLESLGLTYPLLTTEMAKGPAIKRLRGEIDRPVAFVDDLPRNLVSAQESVPDSHLFHLMADNTLRDLLPPPPEGVTVVENWREATPKIEAALGI
ncbi:hypothetical protein [Aquamicrobium sp. LC103]|uniref:hypothetical protein n=1 Tax=Aquamicrobium sp. LC103 TaxID=1120658 RepID=UPI00063E8CF4|nr:hypothetical protein [Aquamicrobium sp. LC103]TKT76822.1 hypothetical protein XW59_015265 [Aquamicrobium sp. LC103]